MNKTFDVNFSNKIGLNPITNCEDKIVCLSIREFINGKENKEHRLYIEFPTSWIDDGVSWEIEQVHHYFEYERNEFKVFSNDFCLFNKLYPFDNPLMKINKIKLDF